MGAIANNDRAILTARSGAARLGAVRLGFVPKDTRGSFYVWATAAPVTTATWTAVKR